ncbi:MAG: hypothetical protein GAK29_01085 [Acinetobacter bereziniae]|uniref:Uncharacterized protein n=1 Tax=Acinetobacter bereziniae TaxID=106648 RepID=A0A833PHC8_ACIBZ|nr:MAG: hypothetical protein GAK29_01085 [Acinetobacter bereziniae]
MNFFNSLKFEIARLIFYFDHTASDRKLQNSNDKTELPS